MTKIRVEVFGDKALLAKADLERLVKLAGRCEDVEVTQQPEHLDSRLMQRAQKGGAFDFWVEEGEGIYSSSDGQAL